MADEPEDDLAMAKRHVREAEAHLARQLVLVKRLDGAGQHEDARSARVLLATLTDTLHVARRHLQIEIETAQRRS